MSAVTRIEWTDRTWSVTRGCSVVSSGCHHCYAMRQAHRFSGPGKPYEGLTKQTKAGPQWTGKVVTVESALLEPLSWRKPQRVFVNSMSDLFHEDVPDWFIVEVFATMALAPRHTFQILTKRAGRLRDWTAREGRAADVAVAVFKRFTVLREADVQSRRAVAVWPLPNVWFGVSVEDKLRKSRIEVLRDTQAAARFLSLEPLLEDPGELDLRGIDWVIVGGESGPGARPFDLAWARSVVDQCAAEGVACFVKQIGSKPVHYSLGDVGSYPAIDRKGGDPAEWPDDLCVRQFPEARS